MIKINKLIGIVVKLYCSKLLANKITKPYKIYFISMFIMMNQWSFCDKMILPSTKNFLDIHSGIKKNDLYEYRIQMKKIGWCSKKTSDKIARYSIFQCIKRVSKLLIKIFALKVLFKTIRKRQLPQLPYLQNTIQDLLRSIISLTMVYQTSIYSIFTWNRIINKKPPLLVSNILIGIGTFAMIFEKRKRMKQISAFILLELFIGTCMYYTQGIFNIKYKKKKETMKLLEYSKISKYNIIKLSAEKEY